MTNMSARPERSGSCFFNRLSTLPIVQATKDLYSQSKERHVILKKSLGVLEYGVNAATPTVESLVSNVPGTSTLDVIACGYLQKLESTCPALHEPPLQVYNNIKCNTADAIKSNMRKALRTYPGRTLIRGLDGMITWSENTLDQIQGIPQPQQHQEQAEVDDAEDISVRQVTTEPGVLVKVGVLTPLEAYVNLLRLMKRILANIAGLDTKGCPSTPGKRGGRRSPPRKRTRSEGSKGVIQRVTGSALGMLGMNKTDAEPASEPKQSFESDSEDEYAESMNLEDALLNYTSDNDPDYQPALDSTVDSLEYEEGHTESDIEIETLGKCTKHGEFFSQIKTAKDTIATLVSGVQKPFPAETPDTNAASKTPDASRESPLPNPAT